MKRTLKEIKHRTVIPRRRAKNAAFAVKYILLHWQRPFVAIWDEDSGGDKKGRFDIYASRNSTKLWPRTLISCESLQGCRKQEFRDRTRYYFPLHRLIEMPF